MRQSVMAAIAAVANQMPPIAHRKNFKSKVRSSMSWGPSPEYADWWYVVSWKGIIWAALATALAASATLIFALFQFWADGIRDARANDRHVALEVQTSEAKRDTAGAMERIATLQAEAEGLKAQAEADRLARVKIEQKLAPRSLSGEQQLAVVEGIKRFAPQPFRFVSYQDDPEVVHLVHGLIRVLIGAGWKGLPAKGFLMAQLEFGVRIEYAPEKAAEYAGAANALASALNEAGLAAEAGVKASIDADSITIRVGKKP